MACSSQLPSAGSARLRLLSARSCRDFHTATVIALLRPALLASHTAVFPASKLHPLLTHLETPSARPGSLHLGLCAVLGVGARTFHQHDLIEWISALQGVSDGFRVEDGGWGADHG